MNEFLESVGVPLEIVDGFIDSIAVTIPWSALVTENCTVEVSGLQITCRPKYRSGESQLRGRGETRAVGLCWGNPDPHPNSSLAEAEHFLVFLHSFFYAG